MPKLSVTAISGALQRVEEVILAWAMLGIVALTVGNAVMRVVFMTPWAFAEELTEFLVIIVCFVGLSYAASKGRHIRMTAIYDQLPAWGRKAFMVVIAGSTSLLLFTLAYFAISYVDVVRHLGTVSPTLRVPVYLVYLAVPIGFILGGVQYALTVIRNLTAPDVYLSYEKKDEYEEVEAGGL